MTRKKWTPKKEITSDVLRIRKKKKWQLALRRYVIEKNRSPGYAFYFGLSIENFRKWIEIQFTDKLDWSNFALSWQFEHVIPVGYFDFSNEEDLKLCWNFVNIRVQKLETEKEKAMNIDLIAAKPYFEALYNRTGYYLCLKIINRITQIEQQNIIKEPEIEAFINSNKTQLDYISTFDKEEFNNLNLGVTIEDILLEREILKKFG